MDPDQIENAIEIAWSPTSDHALKTQALEFVHQLRTDLNVWQICLPLFTKQPQASEQVRNFCLEVLGNSVHNLQSDSNSLEHIKALLFDHVRQRYLQPGSSIPESAHIQNKLAQVFTYLFAILYQTSWKSFFDDFISLTANGNNVWPTIFLFRLLGSIHDEIADVLIARSPEETKRNVELKDLIREKDAPKIIAYWQDLLSRWTQLPSSQITEMCLRTISRWISWSDISLIVNQVTLQALLDMAGQQDYKNRELMNLRDGAIGAFTEITSKGMRPAEKVEVIVGLNLRQVVAGLIQSPALDQLRNTSAYDTDFAELVAKLVNNIVRDIVAVLDSADATDETKQQANELLQAFLPYLLRFFSDDYDEICATVIDALSDILNFFRRQSGGKSSRRLPAHYHSMLPSILPAVIGKMKYDPSSWENDEPDQVDEADEAEFLDLRKRFVLLQQQITAIDESLAVKTISDLVKNTYERIASSDSSIDWSTAELALYETHLFGDLAVKRMNRGSARSSSSASSAVEQLNIMLMEMMVCKVANIDHPAVQLQFSANTIKFIKFYETNSQWIPSALEAFVTYTHSSNVRVRFQSWHNFQRFIRPLKNWLGEISQTIIQAMGDLLPIQAVLASDQADNDSDDSIDESSAFNDTKFSAQLHLFEALGCISSVPSVSQDDKLMYIQSIINPIFLDMERHLNSAKSGDERSIMQIHHASMALGNVAHGFSDWMPGQKIGEPPPPRIQQEFVRCGEVILVALESLNSSIHIRQASRYAFSRLLGAMGDGVFSQLPRWIEGLLSQTSQKEETGFFLRLLGQVIFAFKADISSILDAILTPLFQRVFQKLGESVTGTDDEVHLRELRREFLAFILSCLNHNLGDVFVSTTNQSMFETITSALDHFARDPSDIPTARTAFAVMTRMVSFWGGPDIHPVPPAQQTPSAPPSTPTSSHNKPTPASTPTGGSSTATATTAATSSSPPPFGTAVSTIPTNLASPSPKIPGFDVFAVSRFSPLSWAIPAHASFKVTDAHSRMLVNDIAGLQQEILRKNGRVYLDALAEQLVAMGLPVQTVQVYVERLCGEKKVFQEFLIGFLGGGR